MERSTITRESKVLSVMSHTDATKTFTTVTVSLGSGKLVGVGTSKRNASDEYDAVLGYNLALSRALADLAAELGVH